LKTTNVLLIGNCPKWEKDDIPPGGLAEFNALLGQIQQEILDLSARMVITPDDLRGWHRVLFQKFVPLNYYAGNFRGVQSEYPCLASNVGVAGIAGSHFATVRQDVRILFAVIRSHISDLELSWTQISPADRAQRLSFIIGNFVGGFIRIHPFMNGNGRTSRLLWRWCLLRFGVSAQCRVHPRPGLPYGDLMHQAMAGNYIPLVYHVLAHLSANPPSQNMRA
jgi:fido (protein-threonine AMPylation protein)